MSSFCSSEGSLGKKQFSQVLLLVPHDQQGVFTTTKPREVVTMELLKASQQSKRAEEREELQVSWGEGMPTELDEFTAGKSHYPVGLYASVPIRS